MTTASADTTAISEHEAQEVAETALNFVSRFQPMTGAN